jgi:hypothetical protein
MELAIYEAFREAGIEEKPAKTIAATINKAVEQSVDIRQLATKGDVEAVRVETKSENGSIRAEIEKVRLETKADIEKVRAEIEKAKAEIIKWNIGAIIASAGLAMAIARLFFTSH